MKRAAARAGFPWRFALAAVLMVGAVVAPAAVAHAAPIGGPAVIIGQIRAVGGAPIAGVLVSAAGDASSTAGDTSFWHSVRSKADGSFMITDLPQGTYNLTANEPSELNPVLAFSENYFWNEWGIDGVGDPLDSRHYIAADTTTDAGVITLQANGTVTGRLMDGTTPVSGSIINVTITDGGLTYQRWLTSGVDGRFTIPSARPGDYTIYYTGSGSHVPIEAVPGGDSQNGSVCSGVDSFSIAAGETLARPNYLFQHGTACDVLAADAYSGNTYNVSAIQVTLTSVDDENVVYSFVTGDDGWAHVVMPPGDYDLAWSDQYGVYADGSLPAEQNLTIGGALYRVLTLDANSETYAVSGVITEAGTGDAIFPWVETFKKNPDAVSEPESFRNAQGQGNGAYMVRFPEDTGYTGNQVILTYSDRIEPYPHVQQTFTTAMNPAADSVHNVSMPLGGAITGYVHDDDGLAVEGVQVSATSIQPSPQGGTAYMGGARWYTRTQADGSYMIAGLPTNADYKVNFAAYYDVGMPLQIKYADYYRKTWKNRPYLDSLNESSTPIWVDHTSVPVTLGHMTGSIDETISLGGYVALHADGPAAPTGAVYCDVMYQVPNGKWVEIDSGYTTGGTFQKLWKVLPTGHYRLYYADYFGRGSGTWEFDLAAGEKKYTSVIVPAPINAELPALAGSFAGLINGGLDLGGTGGLQLVADTISALPPGSPAPPTGMLLYADSTFAFVASSADTTGTWTLTLPYDPSIPDAVVSNIRVWHVKSGGIGELLAPIAWNTTLHTVQVQTHSLSPFQVVYSKQKVTLGTPTTSGSLKSNRTFTAYVTLSPLHTPGLKSAQVKAYTYNKRSRKWVVYKIFKAVNQAYRGGTRCKASVKLKKGTYRLYGYAPADAWHLATLGKYRTIKVK